jgi:hypothetical protein
MSEEQAPPKENNIITDVVNDTIANVVTDNIGNIEIAGGIIDKSAVIYVINQAQQQIFDNCLQQLSNKSKEFGLKLEPKSIMIYVKLCMEIVEKTEVKGTEQKELVIKLLTKLVTDAPVSDEQEKLCLDVLSSGIVGDTIDLIILASRGQLDLNVVTQTAKGCLPKCISFFNKNKK